MVFSSALFIFAFLPVTLGVYFIIREKYRNVWLLVVSLFFYAWGEPGYVILMLISIVVNYIYGILLERWQGKNLLRHIVLTVACVTDVGVLFVFKYFNFFIDNVNIIFHSNIQVMKIALPIGISFYTFQILSYVIDVFRNEVKAQKNILNLGLYIALFPQLIAGPIVRYQDVEKEIKTRTFDVDNFYIGTKRFILGFAKKIIIADNMAVLADKAFSLVKLNAPMAWVGIIAYAIQIYYDFSGYSDMAIGIGRMFGFHFNENFNYPYVSKSIKEFWRRWHISLSTWFRDYVYIPLGGSRCSSVKAYRNLIIVFLLTGIWHGASWNFVLWGLYYVIFLILERMFLLKLLEKLPAILQHLYAIVIILFGWILFRAETLHATIRYFKALFNFQRVELLSSLRYNLSAEHIFLLVIGIICATPYIYNLLKKIEEKTFISDYIYIILFALAVMYMTGKGFSPFLYFRF